MRGSLRNTFFKHLTSSPLHPTPRFSPFSLKLLNPCFFSSISTSSQSLFNNADDATSSSSSSSSSYLSVQITCHKNVADMLSESLLCFGASSASIEEVDKYDNNDEICISSIYTDCQDVGSCISHAADSIGLTEIPSYKVIADDNDEWIRKTQESFVPVELTEDFWIVPEWTKPPGEQARNIILNPGLAFGTGDHPTTKLCLLLLHGLIKGGEIFLDYGTGSGILGIAAVKLGASFSVGIDIDPKAVTSAQRNAALNNIGSEKMQVYLVPTTISCITDQSQCGDEEQSVAVIAKKYDIVIANILLNPLLDLADQIVDYAKPGGIVGISGILYEQLPKIEERYSQYLEGVSVSEMDGWVCLSGKKKADSRSN